MYQIGDICVVVCVCACVELRERRRKYGVLKEYVEMYCVRQC
jgi:hypothetical protein